MLSKETDAALAEHREIKARLKFSVYASSALINWIISNRNRHSEPDRAFRLRAGELVKHLHAPDRVADRFMLYRDLLYLRDTETTFLFPAEDQFVKCLLEALKSKDE